MTRIRNRVLITGANGFVGQALFRHCQEDCDHVRAVIRARDPRFQIHDAVTLGELTAQTDWRAALEGVDVVVHLANRAHVMKETAADPIGIYRCTNVDATLHLAESAARHGVRRFVFVSSIHVNGRATQGKAFVETDEPCPVDPYGISKLEAEQALGSLATRTGMEMTVVRPALVYGPGVKGNLRRLMSLVRAGIPLPLRSVANRRSMVGLDNLVDLLMLCIAHPAAAGRLFLTADGHDVSTAQLIREIARAMGRPDRLFACPPRLIAGVARLAGAGDVAERLLGSLQVDASLAQAVLGWHPRVSLEAGIRQMTEAFERDAA